MLLIIHKKAYQKFLNLLLELDSLMKNSVSTAQIKPNHPVWQNLQQTFQQEVITLTDEGLDLATASHWISLQAEIQREFRLLNTDWLFMISARTPATFQAKEKSVVKRLHQLINYCQVMLRGVKETDN